MNRRDSLKALGLSAVSAGLLLEACKTETKPAAAEAAAATEGAAGRQPFEIERDKKLNGEKFFTAAEMETITVLVDIIIPKDDKSGSASDAKVPDFIEFIVKDMPDHQTPVRGGLRWLDLQCLNRYSKVFTDCSHNQQIELIDMIAYPNKAKPEMAQGVSFFNRMRDLTASGFFTSQMGVKDIGYAGNSPGKWTGVPEDILKHYGMENV
ncbi:Gluconate 2-dehydrogenase subunit 3 [Mucilaginibacter pineti]|uniref:Gluconate 2-dehydrogenase subunit 3 n=1 Tax=Mucilaginibacter pineti TaxID=1391627 RepID=A0A1G7DT78_9SPHI|nr:gluconate 2-dehydrogenase subunit 3 family protein [Mucilaginibacter pineti]SDE54729.1 Gluconate 2-dehydrogenase subunit 3 [Mucilaginibacter pineti]